MPFEYGRTCCGKRDFRVSIDIIRHYGNTKEILCSKTNI